MSNNPRPRTISMNSSRGFSLFSLCIGTLLFLFAPEILALSFDRYHTQAEINSYMRSVAADHPSLVRFNLLGYSQEGRDVAYVVISKGDPENLPAIYLNGTHHGNEKSSTEGILGLIDYLVINKNNRAVSEILENYAIYLQPMVNPDGHASNTREDRNGVDPNRDYSYPGSREEAAFRTPVTRLVKQLVDQIKPRAAAAYHSGMEAVLWPLCFTNRNAPDQDLFYTMSKSVAESMGMRRYVQSYFDYPSNGEFIDYVYGAHNTLALTFEISSQGNPPEAKLLGVVQRSVNGAMTFMTDVMNLDRGQLIVSRAPQQGIRPTFLSSKE